MLILSAPWHSKQRETKKVCLEKKNKGKSFSADIQLMYVSVPCHMKTTIFVGAKLLNHLDTGLLSQNSFLLASLVYYI